MVIYENFIEDFLRYLYDALHKQCLVENIFLSDSYIRYKSKFSNFQGYETHYPSRGFSFSFFSFQDFISGLISTTLYYSTGLSVRYQFDITIY